MKKDVALVLSSGGPRGFAYIGAIEELLSRDYNITSVAGTSIGSLIGGIFAAGRLPQIKDWLYTLDAWKVFTLMDLSISKNHLVKGDRVIEAIKEIVPDVQIEDLRIPFKAIATDLYTGEEVIFDEGDLFDAIRASISIPSLFRPVKYGYRTLIDGGIVNAIPLNRVDRNGHDILVAFDVNDVDVEGIRGILIEEARSREELLEHQKQMDEQTRSVMASIRKNGNMTFKDKVRLAGQQGFKVLADKISSDARRVETIDIGDNYYSILSRTFSLMNHVNSEHSISMNKPDVLVKMPFDAYGEISDYAKASEIAEIGRELMKKALDKYEAEEN
ncbi:MAG: patatin-like phospholipase family protein [Bacteroidales bacterium]|nr:patatin-like phospholipase family protein [Bacteroidales bacterium]